MRLVKGVLVLIIFVGLIRPVSASTGSLDIEYFDIKTNEQIEYEYQESVQKLMEDMSYKNDTSKLRSVPIYYKYDYVKITTETRWISGFPGNQPAYGYNFPTGGIICWVDSSGPTASLSFTWTVISVNLGNVGSSTNACSHVPADRNYYKLKVSREVSVTKTSVYGYPTTGGPRVFLYNIYPSILLKVQAVPVKQ